VKNGLLPLRHKGRKTEEGKKGEERRRLRGE